MTSSSPASTAAVAADFSRLPLSPAMLANLQQLGYLAMTPIQAASLPAALLGKDIIAQAKTGSGKTAAFALTLLSRLNPRRFAVQALVLVPDARTGRPGHHRDPPAGPGRRQHQGRHAVRRRAAARAAGHAGARRAHRGRHARARDGPPGARKPEARCAGHPGARRGRPHARHGLFRRHRHRGPPVPEERARPCCSRPPTPKASPNWRTSSCASR